MNAPETVCSTALGKTDKTGETDLVTNVEFLRAVFGDLAEVRPVLVSFAGKSDDVAKKAG